jgi:hypothetical protein
VVCGAGLRHQPGKHEEIIDNFERTGDIVYWDQFVALLRAEVRRGEAVENTTNISAQK